MRADSDRYTSPPAAGVSESRTTDSWTINTLSGHSPPWSPAGNDSAALHDLGDGVLCVEFHSKMNAIGADAVEMLQAGVQEASRNFSALVVGNDAHNFSAGANLMLLLLEAQEQNWEEIDLMVRAFQGATAALRYSDVPVVVAPAGMTLGGGCECGAARRPDAGGGGNLHGAGRGGRRVDPGRRRHRRRCWRARSRGSC